MKETTGPAEPDDSCFLLGEDGQRSSYKIRRLPARHYGGDASHVPDAGVEPGVLSSADVNPTSS
jgi:hypothetical protein